MSGDFSNWLTPHGRTLFIAPDADQPLLDTSLSRKIPAKSNQHHLQLPFRRDIWKLVDAVLGEQLFDDILTETSLYLISSDEFAGIPDTTAAWDH